MKFYKRLNSKKEVTTIESCSHNLPVKGAIEISEAEYNKLKTVLVNTNIEEPVPRDLAKEIDDIKAYLNIA